MVVAGVSVEPWGRGKYRFSTVSYRFSRLRALERGRGDTKKDQWSMRLFGYGVICFSEGVLVFLRDSVAYGEALEGF